MEERVLGYGVIGTGVYCDHYFGTLGPVFKNLLPPHAGMFPKSTPPKKCWRIPKLISSSF